MLIQEIAMKLNQVTLQDAIEQIVTGACSVLRTKWTSFVALSLRWAATRCVLAVDFPKRDWLISVRK